MDGAPGAGTRPTKKICLIYKLLLMMIVYDISFGYMQIK